MNFARAYSKRIATTFAFALLAAVGALALTAAAPASAATCPSFSVLHNDRIGPASFPAGSYEVTVEPGLSCKAASQLFARFLEDYDGVLPKPWRVVAERSGGTLPFPWRLKNQTATFYKPAHPERSAFRIEPIAGA